MDDAQLIDSPGERPALTFVQFADYTGVGPDFVQMRPTVGMISSDIRLKLGCWEIHDEGSDAV